MFDRAIWRQQLRATLFFWGLLPLLVLGSGLAVDGLCSFERWPASSLLTVAAGSLLVWGAVLVYRSTLDLYRLGQGTPSPLRPAKTLVTEGPYRLCRHPMHFGYALMLLAAVFMLRSPATLFMSYPLFLGWSIIQLRKEEQVLRARFRDRYARYQAQVPFFLPRLRGRWGKKSP